MNYLYARKKKELDTKQHNTNVRINPKTKSLTTIDMLGEQLNRAGIFTIGLQSYNTFLNLI